MANNNDELGIWTDHLSDHEVEFSIHAAEALKQISWAKKLLKDLKVKRAIKISKEDKLSNSEIKQLKATFFELRFAYALHQAGLTADYEHSTDVGKSTVDFKVNSTPTWLVELTSLREGEAIKKTTSKAAANLYICISLSEPGKNQLEVIDLIRSQRAICSKVSDPSGNPTKFSQPSPGTYNMIIIDMRSFNAGGFDKHDFQNVAWGSKTLTGVSDGSLCRVWIYEDGTEELITGVFDEKHPDPNTKLIQERIHAIGFIGEKTYEDGALISSLRVFGNPLFFKTDEEFQKVFPKELIKNGTK